MIQRTSQIAPKYLLNLKDSDKGFLCRHKAFYLCSNSKPCLQRFEKCSIVFFSDNNSTNKSCESSLKAPHLCTYIQDMIEIIIKNIV